MKKIFTKKELIKSKGCYSEQQIIELYENHKKENVSIFDILNSEINIKDKRWFVYNACKLSLVKKKSLALKLAWEVLPIYENKYPNDLRIWKCLQTIKNFNSKKITKEELKNAAYAANAAAYASYAAAYAANAAYAADAADAAAESKTYSEKLTQILIDFFNDLPIKENTKK